MARTSWHKELTVRQAHDDLFVEITRKQPVADQLWLGFDHIERATELIDTNALGFAFPVRGMLMKHYRSEPLPEWWDEVNEHYSQAMIEFYRSHSNANARGRPLLFYWAKRGEYVLSYLRCVKSIRKAALTQNSGGDQDLVLEHLATAIEHLYNAIDTLSDIVRDESDRGLIATLNVYAYQPLIEKYEELVDH